MLTGNIAKGETIATAEILRKITLTLPICLLVTPLTLKMRLFLLVKEVWPNSREFFSFAKIG